jgi:hypothetical protein
MKISKVFHLHKFNLLNNIHKMFVNLYGQITSVKDDHFIFNIDNEEDCKKFRNINDMFISKFSESDRLNNPIQNSSSNFTNKYELKVCYTYKSLINNNLITILEDENNIETLLIGKHFKLKLEFKSYNFTTKKDAQISGYKLILN